MYEYNKIISLLLNYLLIFSIRYNNRWLLVDHWCHLSKSAS